MKNLFFFLIIITLPGYPVHGAASEYREAVFVIDENEFTARIDLAGDGDPAVMLTDLAEAMGYKYEWDAEKRHVIMGNDENYFIILADENKCVKNGLMMYVSKPAYIADERVYLPLSILRDIMDIYPVSDDIDIYGSTKLNTLSLDFRTKQENADAGIEKWRIDPLEVAERYVRKVLRFQGGYFERQELAPEDRTRIAFFSDGVGEIHIDLYQPLQIGEDGIWEIEYWFDSNSNMYWVRDIAKLPPLFSNDENMPEKYKEQLRGEITGRFAQSYSMNYDVLGFESRKFDFGEAGNRLILSFELNMVIRNKYRDPDTAGYIADAKQGGSSWYLTMYYEYNAPKENNYVVLVEADILPEGGIGEVMIYIGGSGSGMQRFFPIDEMLPLQ